MTVDGVRVWAGPDALDEAGPALDELLQATGAPVDARRPWLAAVAAADVSRAPWLIAVEDAHGGLVAAALLARGHSRLGWTVTALGHDVSDRTWLAARDAAAAHRLAAAVADELHHLDGPWILDLEQLRPDDPTAARLAELLPAVHEEAGDGSPALRLAGDRQPSSHLSKSTRGNFRNARNRMGRDGHEPTFAHLRDLEQVAALLPEMERVHREQDAWLNRRSRFSDDTWRGAWEGIVRAHAERGELELNVLQVDGRLGAYSVCFLDGDAYRYWNIAFDPDLDAYSPGSTLWVATIEHVLSETACTTFDFMRGEEPYKLRLADDVVPTRRLVASSSRALLAVARAPRRARDLLDQARERSEGVDRAVDRVKRVVRRGRS